MIIFQKEISEYLNSQFRHCYCFYLLTHNFLSFFEDFRPPKLNFYFIFLVLHFIFLIIHLIFCNSRVILLLFLMRLHSKFGLIFYDQEIHYFNLKKFSPGFCFSSNLRLSLMRQE